MLEATIEIDGTEVPANDVIDAIEDSGFYDDGERPCS